MTQEIHPALSAENLVDEGFVFPGQITPIDVIEEPEVVTRETHDTAIRVSTTMDRLANRATAHMLFGKRKNLMLNAMTPGTREITLARMEEAGNEQTFFQSLESSHTLRRLDNLVAINRHPVFAHNYSLYPIELNAVRPAGHNFLDILRRPFGEITSHRIPETVRPIASLLRSQADEIGIEKPNIVLTYAPGYAGEFEIPELTHKLKEIALEEGWDANFAAAQVHELEDDGVALRHGGNPVDLVWRNWAGTDLPANIRRAEIDRRVKIINPGETVAAGFKYLFATIYSDLDFHNKLSAEDIQFIQDWVPESYAAHSADELIAIGEQRGGFDGLFLKASRGSSGASVFRGRDLTNKDLETLSFLADNNNPVLLQKEAEPSEPSIPVSFIRSGNRETALAYKDYNPYVYNHGGNRKSDAVLVRGKDRHPINVSQGGGMTVTAIAKST